MSHAAKVLVRPYEPRDRKALDTCVCELQNHEIQFEPRMKPAADIIQTYVDDQLKQCSDCDGAILVAELEGEIVGYTSVFAAVPNDDPDETAYTYALVRDLSVLAAHRGQGIGSALLTAAKEFAHEHGATCLRIFALAGNTGAVSLYQRFGFKPRAIELEMPTDR